VDGIANRRERIAQLVRQHRQEFVLGLFREFALGNVDQHVDRAEKLPRFGADRVGMREHRQMATVGALHDDFLPVVLLAVAQSQGHHPQVILSGRAINDGMGAWVAEALHETLGGQAGSVLVLGLTFKEDVPDLRNSRVFDLVARLRELGHEVAVADPLADPAEVAREYGLSTVDPDGARYDLVVGAVAHADYRGLSTQDLERMVDSGGTLADLKGMWRDREFDPAINRWSL